MNKEEKRESERKKEGEKERKKEQADLAQNDSATIMAPSG